MAYFNEDNVTEQMCIEVAKKCGYEYIEADTLGAIVGSIAEAIWGIPMQHRIVIEAYLPNEMCFIMDEFYKERPKSFKPLIDTTFYKKEYSEAAWDMLEDKVREELHNIIDKEKDEKRQLMVERGKARENW